MLLHISNYGDINSGWAIAAQEVIRALSLYTKVVTRRFKFAPQNPPSDLLALETDDECKICIQQCLPNMMVAGDYYNIGACFVEGTLGMTGWAQYLNLMDEVWTFSNHSKEVLEKEVIVPIRVFPLPINHEKLYAAPSFNLREQCQGDFLFYTILDFNKRKNLTGLIKAFHLEFAHWEPVNLVIKTNAPEQDVFNFCNQVKQGLKLYNPTLYKREVIISGHLDKAQIYALHKNADVFVLPSHGEGWSIPTQEALSLGKTPIVSDYSSFKDYITPETGWLIPCGETNCFNSSSIEGVHTGWETWGEPNLDKLRKALREAYTDGALRQTKSIAGIRKSLEFTHEKVGKMMYDALPIN